MASTTRLLDQTPLAEGGRISALNAPDMGDGATLEVVITVNEATDGESPVLALVHAPAQEDDAWLEFPTPIRVSLARTGRTWVHVPCSASPGTSGGTPRARSPARPSSPSISCPVIARPAWSGVKGPSSGPSRPSGAGLARINASCKAG